MSTLAIARPKAGPYAGTMSIPKANTCPGGASRPPLFQGIVGHSGPMLDMYDRIGKIAPHYRNALVTGETGAGKELVARALHDISPVHNGHFVVINCSAVVETLFESELFGHVRGAFTGAD